MNYRHAFHAGNHADVFKHAVLARVLSYLARKEKPFRVIDTHAGIGLYDLGSEEAVRSPEWREGIGRVLAAHPPVAVAELLAPYLSAVRAANGGAGADRLLFYPGSPRIVRHLMRPGDRMTAVELHPADQAVLAAEFAGDGAVRVLRLDGWLALAGHVPPKERRGVVLVDPPFEEAADWERLVDGLARAHRRWPGGVYLLWHPVTAGAPVTALKARLAASGVPRILHAGLCVRGADEAGLVGSGLVVVNPPFVLRDELAALLPWLAGVLSEDGRGRFRVELLAGE